jgi:MFS family permease
MFYGWRIVSVVFLTHFISVGLVFYSYGVFFKALAEDFGGSRLGVATGLAILNVVVGLLSPFVGRAVDRGSIRHIMCAGAFLMAIGFMIGSRIEALWQFYVVIGTFLSLGTVLMGALAGSTLVANWFTERRGTALGISGMGISLSGLAMAPIATALIAAIGWRNTFLLYGAVTLVAVVPAVWLVIVNRPEDLGMAPDGEAVPSEPVPPAGQAVGVGLPAAPERPRLNAPFASEWSARDSMRNRNFWVIGLVIALNFCANGAVLTHIIPHATDIGFEPLAAAWVLSTIAGLGVVGKVVFGWIVDRVPKQVAVWIATGLQGVGVALILNVEGYRSLLLAGAIFGLGMGGGVPLWGALIGAGFGRMAFGRVMGLMTPVMVPVQILGIPYAGWIYDRTGSYDIAFTSFLGVYGLAMFVLLLLRLPEVEPGTASRTAPESAGARAGVAASGTCSASDAA